MNDKPSQWSAVRQPPFADFMGMKVTHVSPDRVTAELLVTEQISNRNGVLHGGALMALADNLGGTAAVANLQTGQITTTIESKTNFFAASRSAIPRMRNARHCIAAARPRSGKRASPAATASWPHW